MDIYIYFLSFGLDGNVCFFNQVQKKLYRGIRIIRIGHANIGVGIFGIKLYSMIVRAVQQHRIIRIRNCKPVIR